MIVVDTHSLIWWRLQHRRLSRRAREAMDRARTIYVPDAVCFEIALLVHAGELRLNVPARTWLQDLMSEGSLECVMIDPEIAVAAASLQQSHLQDPMDSLIAATALRLGLPLVTSDNRMHELPAIETIW
jgi:PIN domain nuclease of toxin-antitoxin system